ncbi:MAG: D-tyrosyl-tRNA(Tyr) deacylase [Candidatus Arcticimaribacter sp.]|nr:D-aminoacyl-tRNA deacylase [Flavobacteriaceae bacterium]MDC1285560.1 D-aminoacyl-tRNA deacylase [Flavobacteriaceae bacterium]PSR10495.1 MAG: D-tyrosyl-tRNA(Tyr) deacylase [Candidatus Arcticimaribacter sp.]PTM01941.1 MAG: D-tyrosyl-tRNA(Tyr) deacylase [Candidatus Arcticimaribacter sp.]
MRVVIQRVKNAQVDVENKTVGSIDQGLVVLLGIEMADTLEDVIWTVKKITQLRIFSDTEGVMNRSLLDVAGELLLISQFTLMAATKKGNRPSYIRAAKHDHAIPMYEAFIAETENVMGKPVATGVFGADMQVSLCNDGPVTLQLDSKNKE